MNYNVKSVTYSNPKLQAIKEARINSLNQNTSQDYEEIDYNVPLSDIESTNYSNTDIYSSIDYSKIKEDGFISQSLVRINGKTFITAYTKKENTSTGGHEYSRIYVYDDNGNYEGKMTLNNDAHVGGISYDKENNILYVTNSNGKIDAYDYNKIINNINTKNSDYTFYLGQDYQIPCDINLSNIIDDMPASTIYYDNGHLYACKYVADDNGILMKIPVTMEDGKITANKNNIYTNYNMPKQIQGVAHTTYNGKEYLIVTCSAGVADGRIHLYEYNNITNEYNRLGHIYTTKMVEGVDIDSNGNVSIIYEKEKMNTKEINMDYLIDNVKLKHDYQFLQDTASFWMGTLGVINDDNDFGRAASNIVEQLTDTGAAFIGQTVSPLLSKK